MAKNRTGEEINADFVELNKVLERIGKSEKNPLEQIQYIAKELPEFIESIWQKGYAVGYTDGVQQEKTKPFNYN